MGSILATWILCGHHNPPLDQLDSQLIGVFPNCIPVTSSVGLLTAASLTCNIYMEF
jgi:hypothetical protein